jgi:hypothetical protein
VAGTHARLNALPTFVVALVMPPHGALIASEGDSDLLLVAEPATAKNTMA